MREPGPPVFADRVVGVPAVDVQKVDGAGPARAPLKYPILAGPASAIVLFGSVSGTAEAIEGWTIE